jgi:chromate transporter
MDRLWEILWRFALLGCTSFGGPAAHLGYFRREFVDRLGWLDDAAYGRLIALSQFLPGPGSSQVGFAIGLERAGLAGGIAAFLGFTLPSFAIMLALATGASAVAGAVWFEGLVDGLKLLAVVVVADAVLGMGRSFCTTRLAAGLAVATAAVVLVAPGVATQLGALAIAAAVGAARPAAGAPDPAAAPRVRPVLWPLVVFAVLLLGLPLLAGTSVAAGLFADFYRAGALVFGGGHVVLPLLQDSVGTALSTETFLTGYAAAQGVPGPMFTLATFLGASLTEAPLAGAALATAAIFLPGFLLVLGLRGAWDALAARPRVAGGAAAVNAAVVGLLAAALYRPVFVSAVTDPVDLAVALVGGFVLMALRPPILVLVAAFALWGVAAGLLGP